MTTTEPTCECSQPGFCERRGCTIPGIHFRKCQAGQVVVLDQLYADQRPPEKFTGLQGPVLPKNMPKGVHGNSKNCGISEPVGTALKVRIEKLITVKTGKGCGCQNLVVDMDKWGIAGSVQRREEIITHLVNNRDVLVEALRTHGTLGHAAGLVAGMLPDIMLRAGAGLLLDQAIADVQAAKTQRRPAGVRGGIAAYHPPIIGVPIDHSKLQSHILYHVMPLSGESEWVWRRHCNWLQSVRQNFNGRMIVGIVTPGQNDAWSYCPPDAVREAMRGLDAEFIEAPNDTGGRNRKHARGGKGEGVLFPQMLGKLKTSDPDHVAFYGHCKGVTRPNTPLDSAIHKWAEAMFECLFRNHNQAVEALDTSGVCGSFRMPGGYKDGGPGIGSNWFYSGTFFAMRLADVFTRNWEKIPNHYGSVEQWPRLNFDIKTQAACLFLDNVTNLYDEAYWINTVTPVFEQWKIDNGTSRAS